jgi:hypothetical protein
MIRTIFCLLLVAVWSSGTLPGTTRAQERHFVELEILADAGTMIDSAQEWLEILSEVGADSVRMGRAAGNSKVGVKKNGRSWTITGVISSRNQLILPGGRYSRRDKAAIKAYVDSIRADGAEVALAEKMAFGLTARQLVDLHTTLTPAYEDSTVGVSPARVLDNVRRLCQTPIVVDDSARPALRDDYQLQDELKGLSLGTSLAAALRPLGLVMAPRREAGKSTEIVITDSRRVEEHWPIGWPLQQRPSEGAPRLYERIPVNISNYTLAATLPAIQSALQMPFLYDYNSLARTGVDLEEIRVNLQAEQMSYLLILNRVLAQARPRMEYDIRADEKGTAFLWFSSR